MTASRAGALTLPWFYGWNVLGVGMMSMAMTMGVVFAAFSFFAVAWMEAFGTSRGETLLILSVAQLVTGFMYPFTGRAMDRSSLRWIGAAGILCLSAGLFVSSLTTALWQLMAIYALLMAGANALAGALYSQTVAARWFRGRRGLALGLSSIGSSIGALVFPLLVSTLLGIMDWRQTMQVLALVIPLLAVPLMLLVIADSPEQKGIAPDPELVEPNPGGEPSWTTSMILRERYFWAMLVALVPIVVTPVALTGNLAPYAQDLGISPQAAGGLMSIWALCNIFGKVSFGYLADRIEQRLLYLLALLPSVMALMLLLLAPSYLTLLLAMIALGIGSGGYLPLIGMMISRHFGVLAYGSVVGLFLMCTRATVLAPPGAGWVRDHFGSYDYFWMGVLGLFAICAPAIVFVRDRARA
ncbi:MAG: MFS transporter [Gammaproteobacteria bacterium]|nr:MFS transporter [Gammaproteobacteria bacterium]